MPRQHRQYTSRDDGEKECADCHGHLARGLFPKNARNVDGRDLRCKSCCAAKTKAWRAANPVTARESEYRWRDANRDHVRQRQTEYCRGWREQNRDSNRSATLRWKLRNPDKVKAASRRHMKENPAQYAARAAKRRAQTLQATPPWLDSFQFAAMNSFYDEARARSVATGVMHHVDHIEPLCGPIACGLHVPWNLQVLTAEENQRKWIRSPASQTSPQNGSSVPIPEIKQ